MSYTKLTKQELQQIQYLRNRIQLAQQDLGKLEMQKIEIYNYVTKTRELEASVFKTLEQKYGQGSIDLEKGEFIPAVQTQPNYEEKVPVSTVE